MARLLKKPYPLTQPILTDGDYEEYKQACKKQEAEFKDLYKKSEWIAGKGGIEGLLFGHPIADGCAWYLVVKSKPLTLQWVPYSDAWEAPAYVIRGLRVEDLR